MKYAVRVTGDKGTKYWVCEHDSWFTGSEMLAGVYVWDSAIEATAFAEKWKGHPWWVIPVSFEIVPMQPHMQQVGWEPCPQ